MFFHLHALNTIATCKFALTMNGMRGVGRFGNEALRNLLTFNNPMQFDNPLDPPDERVELGYNLLGHLPEPTQGQVRVIAMDHQRDFLRASVSLLSLEPVAEAVRVKARSALESIEAILITSFYYRTSGFTNGGYHGPTNAYSGTHGRRVLESRGGVGHRPPGNWRPAGMVAVPR